MPGGLPEGLVTTTDSVGEEIGNEHRVDLEQVARLWRGRRARVSCRILGRLTLH